MTGLAPDAGQVLWQAMDTIDANPDRHLQTVWRWVSAGISRAICTTRTRPATSCGGGSRNWWDRRETTVSDRPNVPLARQILGLIEADPQAHNQKLWRCKTGQCFGGWVAELDGVWRNPVPLADKDGCVRVGDELVEIDREWASALNVNQYNWDDPHRIYENWRPRAAGRVVLHVSQYAAARLRLSETQAQQLFAASNTTAQLRLLVDRLANSPGGKNAD